MFFLEKIIKKIEKQEFVWSQWISSFLAIIFLRVFFEEILMGFKKKSFFELVVFWGHTFSFFLFSYLIFLLVLKRIIKEKTFKIANILLWGFWIIIFPPFLDKLFFGDQFIWSFYLFADFRDLIQKFFLFFGDNLRIGMTLGVRIEILLALIGISFYVFKKKRQKKWFFISFFIFYLIFYILGSFPSWVALLIEILKGENIFSFTERDIVGHFLTTFSLFGFGEKVGNYYFAWKMASIYNFLLVFVLSFFQFKENKLKFWALFKNIRFPQMTFNSGLFIFGLGLGWIIFPENLILNTFSLLTILNLWIAIFSAWYFSVLINDEEDLEIDKITNQKRPLPLEIFSLKEYRQYRVIFLFFSLFVPYLIDWRIFFIFLIYHGLTFLYSCPPFRLKRFLGLASFISALASSLFILIGYFLFSGDQALNLFPWKIVSFLFLSSFLTIPLKDLKDLRGDGLLKVWTLPVLVGEKKARLILASLFLFNYLISVYVFREESLFLPAIFFGSVTFWLVVNQKIKTHFLAGWVMFLLVGYFLFLLKNLFY